MIDHRTPFKNMQVYCMLLSGIAFIITVYCLLCLRPVVLDGRKRMDNRDLTGSKNLLNTILNLLKINKSGKTLAGYAGLSTGVGSLLFTRLR
jgi:hypothetical protein